MDTAVAQEFIDNLSRKMLEKGLINPQASLMLNAHVAAKVYMHWDEPGREFGKTEIVRDPDISQAFTDAFALVESLPSAEEAKRQQFMNSLASVIDLGRENGIEVDFINPLTETMKRLSENALTYQPKPSDYTEANLSDFDDGSITP